MSSGGSTRRMNTREKSSPVPPSPGCTGVSAPVILLLLPHVSLFHNEAVPLRGSLCLVSLCGNGILKVVAVVTHAALRACSLPPTLSSLISKKVSS